MRTLLVVGPILPQANGLHVNGGPSVHRCNETVKAISAAIGDESPVLVVRSQFVDSDENSSLSTFTGQRSLLILVVVEAAGDDGFRFIRAGCAGLLRPGIPPEQLQMVLTRVMAGEIWAPPTILSRVIRHLMRTDNQPFLTSREQQVFELVSSGLRNQDVADALFISRETVRWHMRSIYAKLGKGAVHRIRGPHSASR